MIKVLASTANPQWGTPFNAAHSLNMKIQLRRASERIISGWRTEGYSATFSYLDIGFSVQGALHCDAVNDIHL